MQQPNRRHTLAWLIFLGLVYVVLAIKLVTLRQLSDGLVFGAYSVVVTTYILSRFVLAYLHVPVRHEEPHRPSVSFVIPCKNEQDNIAETMLRLLEADYPRELVDMCVVNDGSDDDSLARMTAAAEEGRRRGYDVTIVDWEVNRGKREAMAEGIRRTGGEIVVLVDSDSFLAPDCVHELVQPFRDERVSAVAGHARVHNANTNLLTKMQNVRYYIAFTVYKAAETLFSSVTCCSGCCSAYRRSHLDEVLDAWLSQEFLGTTCTYGDDRSLTNHLLRLGYLTTYAPTALATTVVPETWPVFLRQQLRWKKSWVRESMIAATFMYRRHPVMAASFYAGLVLPLFSPLVVMRSFFWIPIVAHRFPVSYLFGLFVMAMIYGLYYYISTRDRQWLFGLLFATLSTVVLVWQLPLAVVTLRDGRWGTR